MLYIVLLIPFTVTNNSCIHPHSLYSFPHQAKISSANYVSITNCNHNMYVLLLLLLLIIIIIALKGAIQDLLTAPQTVSNIYAQVARAQLCTDHMQHIERLRATCHVLPGRRGTAQLLCFDRGKIALILALYYWLKSNTCSYGSKTNSITHHAACAFHWQTAVIVPRRHPENTIHSIDNSSSKQVLHNIQVCLFLSSFTKRMGNIKILRSASLSKEG